MISKKWLLMMAIVATGCTAERAALSPHDPIPVEIVRVEAPVPAVEGSPLLVTALGVGEGCEASALFVEGAGGTVELDPAGSDGHPGPAFAVTPELLRQFGPGQHPVQMTLSACFDSEPFATELFLADSLPLSLISFDGGDVHRNDLSIVDATGLLGPSEGTVSARFVGNFRDEDGVLTAVDATLPVGPAERFDRRRGLVRLTTAIGGLGAGEFDGTVVLSSTTLAGAEQTSEPRPVWLRFGRPELLGMTPNEASLEQVIRVEGAGFVGGPSEPDEFTTVRIEGTFTPTGGIAFPFAEELFLSWVSGQEMRGVVTAVERDGQLVSELFGHRRGTFEGVAVPSVQKGSEVVVGDAVPFSLTLRSVTQVVYVKFLPGFYESLPAFGLASGAGEIEARLADRISEIFGPWDVEVRLERPTDFSDNGYATIEVGGADPNGMGLFGYDNTPLKDVGNVRLFDVIGGRNAETAANGYPGYGGVFVESFLFWSNHPGVPRPRIAVPPDPLFDEIFDPVRDRPVTLAEVAGDEAEPARAAAVQRALRAFVNLVAETAAHELGHSLGLAQPCHPDEFHHQDDRPGCLMDAGSFRPLGERAGEPGFAPTRICTPDDRYLDLVLGQAEPGLSLDALCAR